jgi:phosphatidylglycerol lysyltransferase
MPEANFLLSFMLRAYLIKLNIEMSSQTAVSVKVFDKDAGEDISTLTRVREIVLCCGWNSTSYQIINPGIRHWFSGVKKAVVGFVSCNGIRVVAGAPICEKSDLREAAAEFERDAAEVNERVCYFCAERRLETICSESKNYAKVLLGAQPVWQPQNWAEIIKTHKSLRAQLNRARNKNVKVKERSGEKARNHPALEKCLSDWLSKKGLPPLAFLVEPDTLSHLADRRVFVAEREGETVGFVLLSPVAQRNGWLFEQFIHCPDAPNGTVELMIDAAMRILAKDGYEYATLGLAPLSTRADIPQFENPLWLHILLFWMRKHAGRFYNFDGLDAFKAKLQPERWEPVFAISNERSFSFRTLYAIASAFSGGAPVRLFLGGIWRAVLTEINWLKQKIK